MGQILPRFLSSCFSQESHFVVILGSLNMTFTAAANYQATTGRRCQVIVMLGSRRDAAVCWRLRNVRTLVSGNTNHGLLRSVENQRIYWNINDDVLEMEKW